MKKKYYILLALFGFMAGYSQVENHGLYNSVFTDAQDFVSGDLIKKDEILSHYFNNNSEIDDFNDKYGFSVSHFTTDPNRAKSLQDKNSIQAGFGLGAITKPGVAIDALGTFIAERFKQEINIAFLTKFKEELQTLPYMGELFPESKKVLLSSDPYNYPVFINALRDAFTVDAANLVTTVPLAMEKLNPDIGFKVSSLAQIMVLVTDPDTFTNITYGINKIAGSYLSATEGNIDEKYNKAIYILAFSLNAVNKGGTGAGAFIDRADLGQFTDDDFVKVYIPLLVRQNQQYLEKLGLKADFFKKSNEFADKVIGLLTEIAPVFTGIGSEADQISTAYKKHTLTLKLLLESSDRLIDNFKRGISAYKSHINSSGFDADYLETIFDYSDRLIKMSLNIQDKKYGLAFVDLVDIIGKAHNNTKSEDFARFKQYTSFIANALSAEDKDGLIEALETAANPVGSYRVKRNSTFNIALNAYAGGFSGVADGERPLYGFTAPVGIYFGWGNIGKSNPLYGDRGKSLGFFVPLVDVGAVTAFRLKDGETELADVSWDNVFAPGAYLTYGFGKCPVSLSLGGQLGPELKSINNDGSTVLTEKVWYWRASVVIDIPLFDLFTRQRTYKKK